MFPLGSVTFPGVGLPLHVFEPRYRVLVMQCLSTDRLFGSTLIERGSEVGGGDQRAGIGTLLEIVDAEEQSDGRWAVTSVGVGLLRVVEWLPDDPYPRCVADRLVDGDTDRPIQVEASLVIERSVQILERETSQAITAPTWSSFDPDPSLASFQLASLVPLGALDRQKALEAPDPSSRVRFLLSALDRRLEDLELLRALDEDQRGTPDSTLD